MFLTLLIFLYHIIVFTVPGIIRYPYQQIDVNSMSTFVTICVGSIASGVKGVLESIQFLRCSVIFCMGF